jgi:hypothetical protein
MAVTGRSPVQIREAGLLFSLNNSIMFIHLPMICTMEKWYRRKHPASAFNGKTENQYGDIFGNVTF